MLNIFHISPLSTNIGDEVIALGVRQFIDRAFKQGVNIIRLPTQSGDRIGGLTAQSIHAINRLGHGVIVGGGNFLENGRLSLDTAALASLQVPLMLFGISYGYIIDRRGEYVRRTDALPQQMISALADRADVISLRDDATERHFRDFGIQTGRVGACPSLFLDRPRMEVTLPGEIERTILISVRAPETINLPPSMQGSIDHEVREITSAFRKLGFARVAMLCNDLPDIAFAERIGERDYIVCRDVHQHNSLLAHCALSVSFRLHTLLPSLAFGKPIVCAGFDERSLNIMNMIGMGGWMIDLNKTTDVAAAIMDRYNRISEFPELYRSTSDQRSRLRAVLDGAMLEFSEKVIAYQSSMKF